MKFTPAFSEHYPTPWRIQDREIVDCHGGHVQGFEDDPADREFWANVVVAVNAASASAPTRIPVADFCLDVADEIEFATQMHPGPNPNLAALVEEVGEVGKALLDARLAFKRDGLIRPGYWNDIRKEAVQVAAMAFRIVYEGDPTLDVIPEADAEKCSP